MISHSAYPVDPWCLREERLDPAVLAGSESLFALSNGHLGWRGNLDEGEPRGIPGSYLNGVFESRPLPPAPPGHHGPCPDGPEAVQAVVPVTDGKLVRLLVDDEPFDLRYGRLHSHRRVLDLRTGVLSRVVEWTAPSGRTVRVRSWRLVSLSQRAIGALAYEVEPVDGEARIVLQSELLADAPPGEESAFAPEEHGADGTRLRLVHRTRRSGQRVAVAAQHTVAGPAGTVTAAGSGPDLARLTVTARLQPGQVLRLEKLVAHGWSAVRSHPAVLAQVDAALAAGESVGWAGLAAEQRTFLAGFWAGADVELDGDPAVQQAVRFALFQLVQAGARAEERAVPAVGLTGPGLGGQCGWDSELFALRVLTYTWPSAVAQALRWRHRTLPAARRRARALGLEGAVFPVRTVDGAECAAHASGVFHPTADVADAVVRYTSAADDLLFDRDAGLELLVHTARLWPALGHHDPPGAFHLDGVVGPDEYGGLVDDNVFTNLMAQQNLRAAADAAERNADLAVALGVTDEETAAWRDAALHLSLPYDDGLRIHAQSAGFTRHRVWNFAGTPPRDYPLWRHHRPTALYRRQVVQQADLVLALQLHGEAFGAEQKARDFAYYEALTVRDSPLSACSQAVLAAETGQLRLAYDYLAETALLDLGNPTDPAQGANPVPGPDPAQGANPVPGPDPAQGPDLADGPHPADGLRAGLPLGPLAGVWIALVAGFGGMRHHGDTLAFAPRLPAELGRLAFTVRFQRRALRVEVTPAEAAYRLAEGPDLDLWHHGEPFTACRERPVRLPVPPLPDLPEPQQPYGRRPARRGPDLSDHRSEE